MQKNSISEKELYIRLKEEEEWKIYSVSRQDLELPNVPGVGEELLVYGDTPKLSPVLMYFRKYFSPSYR